MQHKAQPETLPSELWLSVASFLASDSLYNLCLVSKGLRSLMQPELFRNYEQPGDSFHPRSLGPFIRVCVARPDLAAAVRKASVYDFLTPEDADREDQVGRLKTKTSEWRRKYDFEIQRVVSKGWPKSQDADDVI